MGSARPFLILIVLVALAGCTATVTDTPTENSPSPALPATNDTNLTLPSADRVAVDVTAVTDGDTVDVRLPDGSEDTVRLLGIDTPEVYAENDPTEFEGIPDSQAGARCLQAAGEDASAYLGERLSEGNVTLVFDPDSDRRGGYDRLLAYVYVDGRNLNYDLVATGHARVYDTDFAFRAQFDAAERNARSEGRRLWACQSA